MYTLDYKLCEIGDLTKNISTRLNLCNFVKVDIGRRS